MMNSQLNRTGLPNTTLRAKVVEDLRSRIESAAFSPGERLPSYADLAQQYGVSDITIRSALRELIESGYLSSRRRSGVYVRTPRARGAAPAAPLSLMHDTVAVLTPFQKVRPGPEHQQGLLRYITLGIFEAVEDAGLHALALLPSRVTPEQIGRLREDPPYGLLATDLGNQTAPMLGNIQTLARSGVPVVVYGGAPELAVYDRVTSDHEAGCYALTRWLIEHGRRRIANLWQAGVEGYWLPHRRAGYERAMREAGLEPLPNIAVPDMSLNNPDESAYAHKARHIAGYLAEHLTGASSVDALLLDTDGHVFPVATACRLLHRQPNREVALAGYDNYWRGSPEGRFEPEGPLITVDKCNREIGAALVQLLRERVEGRLPDALQCRVVAPKLVITESAQTP